MEICYQIWHFQMSVSLVQKLLLQLNLWKCPLVVFHLCSNYHSWLPQLSAFHMKIYNCNSKQCLFQLLVINRKCPFSPPHLFFCLKGFHWSMALSSLWCFSSGCKEMKLMRMPSESLFATKTSWVSWRKWNLHSCFCRLTLQQENNCNNDRLVSFPMHQMFRNKTCSRMIVLNVSLRCRWICSSVCVLCIYHTHLGQNFPAGLFTDRKHLQTSSEFHYSV